MTHPNNLPDQQPTAERPVRPVPGTEAVTNVSGIFAAPTAGEDVGLGILGGEAPLTPDNFIDMTDEEFHRFDDAATPDDIAALSPAAFAALQFRAGSARANGAARQRLETAQNFALKPEKTQGKVVSFFKSLGKTAAAKQANRQDLALPGRASETAGSAKAIEAPKNTDKKTKTPKEKPKKVPGFDSVGNAIDSRNDVYAEEDALDRGPVEDSGLKPNPRPASKPTPKSAPKSATTAKPTAQPAAKPEPKSAAVPTTTAPAQTKPPKSEKPGRFNLLGKVKAIAEKDVDASIKTRAEQAARVDRAIEARERYEEPLPFSLTASLDPWFDHKTPAEAAHAIYAKSSDERSQAEWDILDLANDLRRARDEAYETAGDAAVDPLNLNQNLLEGAADFMGLRYRPHRGSMSPSERWADISDQLVGPQVDDAIESHQAAKRRVYPGAERGSLEHTLNARNRTVDLGHPFDKFDGMRAEDALDSLHKLSEEERASMSEDELLEYGELAARIKSDIQSADGDYEWVQKKEAGLAYREEAEAVAPTLTGKIAIGIYDAYGLVGKGFELAAKGTTATGDMLMKLPASLGLSEPDPTAKDPNARRLSRRGMVVLGVGGAAMIGVALFGAKLLGIEAGGHGHTNAAAETSQSAMGSPTLTPEVTIDTTVAPTSTTSVRVPAGSIFESHSSAPAPTTTEASVFSPPTSSTATEAAPIIPSTSSTSTVPTSTEVLPPAAPPDVIEVPVQKPGMPGSSELPVQLEPGVGELNYSGDSVWQDSKDYWTGHGYDINDAQLDSLTNELTNWRLREMGISAADARSLAENVKLPMPSAEVIEELRKQALKS